MPIIFTHRSLQSLIIVVDQDAIKFKYNNNPSNFSKNIKTELSQIIPKYGRYTGFSCIVIDNRYFLFIEGEFDFKKNKNLHFTLIFCVINGLYLVKKCLTAARFCKFAQFCEAKKQIL